MRSRAALIFFVLLHACSDDSSPAPDAEVDAGEDVPSDVDDDANDSGDTSVTCDPLTPFETGDEGASDPLNVPNGESRAGLIGAGDLPDDPSGLLPWEVGDYVLANDHLAFVIEAGRPENAR